MALSQNEVPVPADALRGICPGIAFAKVKNWAGLDAWLQTAPQQEVLQIGLDEGVPIPRNTLLMSLGAFAGPVDIDCPCHARATAAVVNLFARKDLLDLKCGSKSEPALCAAASHGNYAMCKLLLESRASTPLPVIIS